MRTGLVLEGGGMRGLFTAGLLDVFMEEGLTFDGIVGVSAGATFGCNYKSHQPGRVLRYNLNFRHDPRYMGLRSLWKTGDLVGNVFSYHWLPTHLDIFDAVTFAQDPTEFHVVCTDVRTGQPVYKQLKTMDHEGLDWIRASASMPIVSRPVRLEGKLLLDGGVSDSIPLHYFQQQGFDRDVVVLTQPKGFTKKKTRLMPLFHLMMRNYPAIIHAMSHRHEMYNAQLQYLENQEREGKIVLIYPQQALPIGRVDQNPDKMKCVYEMGRQAALAHLTQVRNFIKKKQIV